MSASEEFFRKLTKNLTPKPFHDIANFKSAWHAAILNCKPSLASLIDGVSIREPQTTASEPPVQEESDGAFACEPHQTPSAPSLNMGDNAPTRPEGLGPADTASDVCKETGRSELKRRNKKPAIPSAKRMTHEDHAISLLLKHPDLLQKEIAEQLGIHPGQVSRMLRLKVLLDARKHRHPLNGRIRRGSKDSRTGEIVAFDEPDE